MPLEASKPQMHILDSTFVNSPQEVRAALDRVDQALKPMDLTDEERFSVELVLAETLNNIVEHAYDQTDTGRIDLRLRMETGGLMCEVSDDGREMPGGALPAGTQADTSTEIEDLPEGGFGWFLIREIARDLTYERASDQNRLSFRIAVGTPQPQALAV